MQGKRLTNRTYHFAAELGESRTDYIADEVGGSADIFRLAQGARTLVCRPFYDASPDAPDIFLCHEARFLTRCQRVDSFVDQQYVCENWDGAAINGEYRDQSNGGCSLVRRRISFFLNRPGVHLMSVHLRAILSEGCELGHFKVAILFFAEIIQAHLAVRGAIDFDQGDVHVTDAGALREIEKEVGVLVDAKGGVKPAKGRRPLYTSRRAWQWPPRFEALSLVTLFLICKSTSDTGGAHASKSTWPATALRATSHRSPDRSATRAPQK